MPERPPRHCTYPGCPTLVDRGRCARHRHKTKRRSTNGYGRDWRRISADYLGRHPLCEIREKCDGARAAHVDHVVPRSRGGTDDDRNLQSACRRCHSWKTATQDTRRTPDGRFA